MSVHEQQAPCTSSLPRAATPPRGAQELLFRRAPIFNLDADLCLGALALCQGSSIIYLRLGGGGCV